VGTGTVGAVEKLQNRPGVRYVEENGTVQISASDNEDSVDSLDVTYSIDSGSSRSTPTAAARSRNRAALGIYLTMTTAFSVSIISPLPE
jgi:hypothetical protein